MTKQEPNLTATAAMIQAEEAQRNPLSAAAINAAIIEAQYWHPEGTLLTVCALTLRGGFAVTGTSSTINPENYNVAIGRDLAYRDARLKARELLSFAAVQERADREAHKAAVFRSLRGSDSADRDTLIRAALACQGET